MAVTRNTTTDLQKGATEVRKHSKYVQTEPAWLKGLLIQQRALYITILMACIVCSKGSSQAAFGDVLGS